MAFDKLYGKDVEARTAFLEAGVALQGWEALLGGWEAPCWQALDLCVKSRHVIGLDSWVRCAHELKEWSARTGGWESWGWGLLDDALNLVRD